MVVDSLTIKCRVINEFSSLKIILDGSLDSVIAIRTDRWVAPLYQDIKVSLEDTCGVLELMEGSFVSWD